MRINLLFLYLLVASTIWGQTNTAENSAYQGFSGGMMLHAGYLFGQEKHVPIAPDGRLCSPQGVALGIGGSIRVHLWKHFRTGFEGMVSTMNSNMTDCRNILKPGSYIRTGCGGILADAYWQMKKAWLFIGGTIGGGSVKGLYILQGNQNTWTPDENSTFHKQSFFYISPYFGCDYCLTNKVHLSFRLDWMLSVLHHELLLPTGPRFYLGFMFCH
ncbi:MAG: hypothetical protein J6Y47_00605 [Bacteroidales bacterium]|nr:hypothetical protein [Bacteroidales bacterium]